MICIQFGLIKLFAFLPIFKRKLTFSLLLSSTRSSLLFPLLPFPLPPLSSRIPRLPISSLISPLCFTSVLLACPFLSPAICLSNMAVPSQLGAFPGNETSNTVPPQHNGPQFCFCHCRYMQSRAKQKNERERETERHKNLNGSPPNNCRWTTNRNSNATFKKCHGCFNSVPFFSGGWTEYTYIVTQVWVFELSFKMLRHFQQIIEVTCSSCSPYMRHLRFEKKIVQMSLKLGSKMYLMANNVEKEMHPRQWGKIS